MDYLACTLVSFKPHPGLLQDLMEAALLECQQTCQTKLEQALAEERTKSQVAIEAAFLEERNKFDKLAEDLKVNK